MYKYITNKKVVIKSTFKHPTIKLPFRMQKILRRLPRFKITGVIKNGKFITFDNDWYNPLYSALRRKVNYV